MCDEIGAMSLGQIVERVPLYKTPG